MQKVCGKPKGYLHAFLNENIALISMCVNLVRITPPYLTKTELEVHLIAQYRNIKFMPV
jgi:hypothetical protein